MTDPDPGKAFPGDEIYLSMPGLGDRLTARIAGEIGDHIHHYDTPNALHCYAGFAPVTRRSDKATSSSPAWHTIITLVTPCTNGPSVASPQVPGPMNSTIRKSPQAQATMPLCAP
ncbi:MAG: IS110 family transposase [Actinomycetota bacterium]|nr:IS110 family transposase [Actinomycetota bacterium]